MENKNKIKKEQSHGAGEASQGSTVTSLTRSDAGQDTNTADELTAIKAIN
jgi:hypothetical protein